MKIKKYIESISKNLSDGFKFLFEGLGNTHIPDWISKPPFSTGVKHIECNLQDAFTDLIDFEAKTFYRMSL